MAGYPLITQAQVVSQDPATGGLYVIFPSGQISAAPVKFGFHGPADGVRVNHPALPGRGTWGIVVFPGGDNRAGVWIASIYTQMIDARATSTDAFLEYNSHFSGFYESLDATGQHVQYYPDGTSIVVSATGERPTTQRHVVNSGQFQVLQDFTDAERVPNPPAPFVLKINTASGVAIEIDGSGNTTVNVKSGKAILNMTAAGNVNITAATQVNVTAPMIDLGASAEALFRLMDERMIAVFNGHVHTNGNAGGNTGTPTTSLAIGAQTTTVTHAG